MAADRKFLFEVGLVDNVSPVAKRAGAQQKELKKEIGKTNQELDNQKLKFIENAVALSALQAGLTGIQSSLIQLGVLEGRAAELFIKMTAAVTLFVSAAQTIQGVIKLVQLLKDAEILLAAVQTYRAVLKNPAMIALAVGGLAVTAGFAGYQFGKTRGNSGGGGSVTTQNSTTNNFNFTGQSSSAEARGVAREVIQIQGG